MSELSEIEHLRKAVARLTIAVWFVAVSVFVLVAFYLITLFFPSLYYSNVSVDEVSAEFEREFGQNRPTDYLNNFHELPIEEKIEKASIVALLRYEDGDDDRLVAVVSEVLKKKPGTEFYYEIGQEYAGASRRKEENTSYGDGVLVFFTGSPATFRFSTSFEDDRIRGLGDMPLEQIRELLMPEDCNKET